MPEELTLLVGDLDDWISNYLPGPPIAHLWHVAYYHCIKAKSDPREHQVDALPGPYQTHSESCVGPVKENLWEPTYVHRT